MKIPGSITSADFLRLSAAQKPADKGNKFSAKPVTVDGVRHDSKHEARGANQLRQLQDAGVIRDVTTDKRQLRYELKVNGVWIGTYTADVAFVVVQDFSLPTLDGLMHLRAGERYICDFKSLPTRKKPDYVLRKNLMLACHGIRTLEI